MSTSLSSVLDMGPKNPFSACAKSVGLLLLPFLFLLFFYPEPPGEEADDYFPTATARLTQAKVFRFLGPIKGEGSDPLKLALAIAVIAYAAAIHHYRLLHSPVEAHLGSSLASHRGVRAPPYLSL